MIEYFVEVYRAYLKRMSLYYGMSPLEAQSIDDMSFPEEFQTLVQFLIDCYGADRSLLTGVLHSTGDLYLAQGEPFNEWEIPNDKE